LKYDDAIAGFLRRLRIPQALERMGYVKARQPIEALFAGESTPGGATQTISQWPPPESRERVAITSSWVYSDIRVIANEASQADFQVLVRQGEELVEEADHPFERLMRQPNPHMGKSFLMQYTLWWLLLRGEAYLWTVPDNSGELSELWPIPASRMRPIPDPRAFIKGYLYQPKSGRRPTIIPPEQVCFLRLPNPFDFHRGLSPLSAYQSALLTDQAAAQWNYETFAHEVTLRTLISLAEQLSKPSYEKIKQEILDELEVKRRRFMVARAGTVDVKSLGIAHKDLEFLAGRGFNRDEIDRAFGIPAGFWAKNATQANAQEAKATLIEQAVWPLLVLVAEGISAQTLCRYYGEDLVGQFKDIRVRDRAMLVTERTQYWKVASLNEARGDLDRKKYEGPLADTIGELPVPLATDPQFVMAMAGITPAPIPGPSPAPMMGLESPSGTSQKDLRRWRGIALRRFRNGENPAGYDFESDSIPPGIHKTIVDALQRATTEEEVKAAFAAGFRNSQGQYPQPPAWYDYP